MNFGHQSAPLCGLPSPSEAARRIAESIVGPVEWQGSEGSCRCPGIARHGTSTAEGQCKVVCQPITKAGGTLPPGVYCFHNSCGPEIAAASFHLRSALGKHSISHVPRVRSPFVVSRMPVSVNFDPVKLRAIAAKVEGVDPSWLAARSPLRPETQTPASFLHGLYKPGENVLIFDRFRSQGQALWTHAEVPLDARELDNFRAGKAYGVWFLTNPIDGEFRENDRGEQSRRSWQNVTAWRYLVLESDEADFLHWLAALAQMPLPIAAIYTSGGKSTHALVRIDAESKAHWDDLRNEMKPALVTLGADAAALTAVRLSRLPGCERVEKRQIQTLLYLDPEPDGSPICEKGGVR